MPAKLSGIRFVRLASLACALSGAGCQQSLDQPRFPTEGKSTVPSAVAASEARTYVFGWGDLSASLAKPRGGTTQGTGVTLAPTRPLPLPEIATAPTAFARDRAAILALAGDYRVSFHFMEALGFAADYRPTRPYHSWATEQVRVLEDRGTFISLQHTLVMVFAQPDGSASAPMLTKHWRQDWTFEDTALHTFRGHETWARRRASAAEAKGAWTQGVFQVDDSPRYEALGRWEHQGNLSVWTSERAWRPLPRREFSVRKDYNVMEGVHRIVLTPTGWLHEQQNWKRVAGETSAGSDRGSASPIYVAEELGLDRYERITAPSLAAADEYWRKTGDYWALVRQVWREEFALRERFTLRPAVDGKRLFEHHFAYAEKLETGEPFDATNAEKHVRSTLEAFLSPIP
ncbi:MAG: hypothetical protein RIQ93_1861 [Verrucomicrobiota bacterium]|jgi:hypothetical protein